MQRPRWRETQVGPLRLLDGGPAAVVDAFRVLIRSEPSTPAHRVTAEAHVAALLHLDNSAFVDAFNASALKYADGNALVLLARMGGARDILRSVTTDVAWDFLRVMCEERGRIPRVALVGGPPGLASAALQVLADAGVADPVASVSGFHKTWADPVAEVATGEPDLVFVGLGTPLEALWAQEYAPALPSALLVPCGGWFGYLVGDEARAPVILRRLGLEWAFRMAQDPARLVGRYARGAGKVAELAPIQVRRRLGAPLV